MFVKSPQSQEETTENGSKGTKVKPDIPLSSHTLVPRGLQILCFLTRKIGDPSVTVS